MENASYTTPSNRPSRFQPSERFSERKRALFPSEDNDSDSELEHILPLERSSSPDTYDLVTDNLDKNCKVLDHTNIRNSPRLNLDNKLIVSPEKIKQFSPNTPTSSIQLLEKDINEKTLIQETPEKISPTQILKTPHDNSNNNTELPRLIRKSLIDISNYENNSLKRKLDSPNYNCSGKNQKLDSSFNKISKARTALFTENIISTKTFYPKIQTNKLNINIRLDSTLKSKALCKPNPVYLCNRNKGRSKKVNFGQINAGVRHGIKKPKHKPTLSKTQLLKAALNIIKNSPLNEYLTNNDSNGSAASENECGVSMEQIQKMDSILKNIDTRTIQPSQSVSKSIVATGGVKRPSSPQNESNRKFFKSGTSKATYTNTINKNIKITYESGEISFVEKQNNSRKPKSIEGGNSLDFSFQEDDEKTIDSSFTDIIKSLEEDTVRKKIENSPTKLVLTAHNSIAASENSIQLHNAPVISTNKKKTLHNDMLLSPTSLVCDMTSGLALNSPDNQTQTIQDINSTLFKNLTASTKKRISFPETKMATSENTKLFPIFYGSQEKSIKKLPAIKENKHVKNVRKIWKPLSDNQTLLDAGQKKFGLTQCPECKLVYSIGEPEDEIMHHNHHNSIAILKFNGWKHERVLTNFQNGRVIQINPNDPKVWWKKVKDLLAVVNQELGFVDVPFDFCNSKVFLYIMNRQIVGCLIAEPKTTAHKLLTLDSAVDQCSEESYPVKCGISRIWVADTHRKRGIATSLMNVARLNFMYGHILSTTEIAFSAPTVSGKIFASKYTKTENFLIYT